MYWELFATQGVFDIVFTLPLLILGDSGDKGDMSNEVAVRETLEGEEKKDAPGSLPTSHQHDQ